MAPEKAEVEVKLSVPVHRIWSAAKQIQVLMPQILPDVFRSCEMDGDGGPGSMRVYHCGPGTPRSAFSSLGYCLNQRSEAVGIRPCCEIRSPSL